MHLQALLPEDEICGIEEIKEGFSCKKYLVTTQSSKYVLRIQDTKKYELFAFELKVTQVAANLKIGPQLVAHDANHQHLPEMAFFRRKSQTLLRSYASIEGVSQSIA